MCAGGGGSTQRSAFEVMAGDCPANEGKARDLSQLGFGDHRRPTFLGSGDCSGFTIISSGVEGRDRVAEGSRCTNRHESLSLERIMPLLADPRFLFGTDSHIARFDRHRTATAANRRLSMPPGSVYD